VTFLRVGVKAYFDPSYIVSGDQDSSDPRIYAPDLPVFLLRPTHPPTLCRQNSFSLPSGREGPGVRLTVMMIGLCLLSVYRGSSVR